LKKVYDYIFKPPSIRSRTYLALG